jgi:hypothetical protein
VKVFITRARDASGSGEAASVGVFSDGVGAVVAVIEGAAVAVTGVVAAGGGVAQPVVSSRPARVATASGEWMAVFKFPPVKA